MPDSDYEAFMTWLDIDGQLADLATLAESKFSPKAAAAIKQLRGTLAMEAQMFQDGAYEQMVISGSRT